MTEAMRDAGARPFAEIVEPHRRELHAHCYRILGSVHDADDAVQEALLGAWKGLSGFDLSCGNAVRAQQFGHALIGVLD